MAARTSSPRDQTTRRDRGGNRALQVARCALCGLERPIGLMVPDGGEACADLRWYCQDARSCTERWTSRLKESTAGPAPAPSAQAEPGPEEPGPDEPEPAGMAAEQHV